MQLNTLTPAKGSVKSNYRRGRGQGSGGGGTATRGHKGAQSRPATLKNVVSKVVRCRYNVVFLNSASKTSTVLNIPG